MFWMLISAIIIELTLYKRIAAFSPDIGWLLLFTKYWPQFCILTFCIITCIELSMDINAAVLLGMHWMVNACLVALDPAMVRFVTLFICNHFSKSYTPDKKYSLVYDVKYFEAFLSNTSQSTCLHLNKTTSVIQFTVTAKKQLSG